MMRDPHALLLHAESTGTIGDIMPRFVYPSTVEELKRTIDPSVKATDRAVAACDNLTEQDRAAWAEWVGAWEAYRRDENATFLWFGSSNKYDEGIQFQTQLGQWQEQLRTKCTIPGPVVSAEDPSASINKVLTAAKWAAGALAVGGAVYLVHEVVTGGKVIAKVLG